MDTINLRAYAKINLGLDVIGRLDNRYHQVRMIMQSINLYDKVNLYRNNTGKIDIRTNLFYLPTGKDNLVYKAAALLMDEFGIDDGISIDLYKYIPVAAGMAGGSTDAAAVLSGINRMFGLGLTTEELMERGAHIGADVPYCIMGGTALAEGIGEKLTRLPDCPDFYVVIGKPGISVSTRHVYQQLRIDENTVHPDIDGMIDAIKSADADGIAKRLGNVLESVTQKEHPVISDIKKSMLDNGAAGALMSGSGPTVFGLFDDEVKAGKCEEILRKNKLIRNSYVVGMINGGRK